MKTEFSFSCPTGFPLKAAGQEDYFRLFFRKEDAL
jgi:hypothetical protein